MATPTEEPKTATPYVSLYTKMENLGVNKALEDKGIDTLALIRSVVPTRFLTNFESTLLSHYEHSNASTTSRPKGTPNPVQRTTRRRHINTPQSNAALKQGLRQLAVLAGCELVDPTFDKTNTGNKRNVRNISRISQPKAASASGSAGSKLPRQSSDFRSASQLVPIDVLPGNVTGLVTNFERATANQRTYDAPTISRAKETSKCAPAMNCEPVDPTFDKINTVRNVRNISGISQPEAAYASGSAGSELSRPVSDFRSASQLVPTNVLPSNVTGLRTHFESATANQRTYDAPTISRAQETSKRVPTVKSRMNIRKTQPDNTALKQRLRRLAILAGCAPANPTNQRSLAQRGRTNRTSTITSSNQPGTTATVNNIRGNVAPNSPGELNDTLHNTLETTREEIAQKLRELSDLQRNLENLKTNVSAQNPWLHQS